MRFVPLLVVCTSLAAVGMAGADMVPPKPSPSEAPRKEPASYRLAWKTPLARSAGLIITPSGDILNYDGRTLSVLDRRNGQVKQTAPSCRTVSLSGLSFLDEKRGLMVCVDRIVEVDFPTLTLRKVVSFTEAQSRAAIGKTVVAVGSDNGKVRVYSMTDWSVIDSFKVPRSVFELALSPNENLLLVSVENEGDKENGSLVLRRISEKSSMTLIPGMRFPARALAFHPDGETFFSSYKLFTIGFHRITQQGLQPGVAFPSGSWTTAARFLTPNSVAATGSRGLSILPLQGSGVELQSDVMTGVAVAADGSLLCATSDEGVLFCYTSGSVRPDEQSPQIAERAAQPATATEPAALDPPKSVLPITSQSSSGELIGVLKSRKGNVVTMVVTEWPREFSWQGGVAQEAELQKQFSTQLLGAQVSGWLVLASVLVKKLNLSSVVTMEIVQESAPEVAVDGKKVNQFAPGARIKLIFGGK